MKPATFLRPWVVFELAILELDQGSTSQNRYPVGVVDVLSTFMFEYPLTLKGDLEIRHELYGAARGPERWRGGRYGTNGEASVSGPETVDGLSSRQPNPIAKICRKDRGGAAGAW